MTDATDWQAGETVNRILDWLLVVAVSLWIGMLMSAWFASRFSNDDTKQVPAGSAGGGTGEERA